MKILPHIPNMITLTRVAGALALLFIPPDTARFYAIYTICGISDVVDGWVARATHNTSELGAKLDSISDMLFYAVMLFRIFPMLWESMPLWIWCIAGFSAIVRICSYVTAAVKYRRFSSLHTYLNKITGFLVFMIPYMMHLPCAVACGAAVCIVALAASAEELIIHIKRSDYRTGIKTVINSETQSGSESK